MTIQAQIAQLKRFAAKDAEEAKLLPPDDGMKNWLEGRSKGYELAARWLERDVLPRRGKNAINPLQHN